MSTYNLHYASCRQAYPWSERMGLPNTSIYDLIVNTELFPENDLVPSIASQIKQKIDAMEGCFEDDHAIRLNEWHDIKEIAEYAQEVMPLIEREIFSCYLKVEFVHPYRNKKDGKEASSWLWHYDDCPQEFIKVFLYLNEVTPTNGCLEYIENPSGLAPKIHTHRVAPTYTTGDQVYPQSRVPLSEIKKFLDEGLEIAQLTGPPGTTAVFTPNIVHRATIPESGTTERDLIVFFLRPCLEKQNEYITENTHSYLPERNVKQYALD